jgi:hypothetical protein
MKLDVKKEYKNSIKFVCVKCKRVTMVKKGSPCHRAGKCGSCRVPGRIG